MNSVMLCLSSFAVSLLLMLVLMPYFIRMLKKHNLNQTVSEYALEEYKQKEKTPIMGGLLFVLIPSLVAILFCLKGLDKRLLFVLLSYLLFASVVFMDDYTILI